MPSSSSDASSASASSSSGSVLPPPGVAQIRNVLRRSAPAKLVGRGAFRGFCRVVGGKRHGHMMHGLTKRLSSRIHSDGAVPAIARRSTITRRGKKWTGKQAGRRRGSAVDAQLSTIANGCKPPKDPHWLTRVALSALRAEGLRLICGQRSVVAPRGNLATAVDLVCMRGAGDLVLVELKTGYDNGRFEPITTDGVAQKMRGPLKKADDCVVHRHLAQLSATTAMFVSDESLMRQLFAMGIEQVSSLVLYVTDDDVEMHELTDWWCDRGVTILNALR